MSGGMTGGQLDPSTKPNPLPFADQPGPESQRVAELRSYDVIDTGAEAIFDALTALAAQLCGAPIALISLVDSDREWFKSHLGIELCGTSRMDSFCTHALFHDEVMIVPDTHQDPRFWNNPFVTADPWIRFYAGAPLTSNGYTMGTLCVLDRVPRTLTDQQIGDQVMAQLTLRRQTSELAAEVERRERSEAALAAQHRMLSGIVSHPENLVYAKDLNGRFLMGNLAVHELFDLPEGSIEGRADSEVLPPSEVASFRRADQAVARTGKRQVFIERLAHRDGSIRTFRSTKFPLRDETGQIYAIAGVSTDISLQQANEDILRESERRWRQLFVGSPVGIGLSNERGLFVAVNPALCRLLGRSEDEVLGRSAAEFTHPDDVAQHRNAGALIARAPEHIAYIEKRYVRPDGSVRWVWLTATHTPGPEGETWTLAHVQDVTDRLAAEVAVRDSEANLAAVAAVVRRIQVGGDARQILVRAAVELSGADDAALLEPALEHEGLRVTAATNGPLVGAAVPLDDSTFLGRAFRSASGLAQECSAAELGAAISTESPGGHVEYAIPCRFGDTAAALLVVGWRQPRFNLDPRRTEVMALLADHAGVALRQDALIQELEDRALTDLVTQLPNRRSWELTLARLMGDAQRHQEPLTIALIDFDHFKAFNDSRGHAAGDILLREFADEATRRLRVSDVLARWGGEEFILALPNCDNSGARSILERIRTAMPQRETCSIGFATLDSAESADHVTARADAALYVAKNSGRNRIQAATDAAY